MSALHEREEVTVNARLRRTVFVWAVPVLVGGVAAIVGSYYLSESIAVQAKRQSNIALADFAAINVSLPTGAAVFPAGQGSDIANTNCLICHSAGMVLRQPLLTVAEWSTEINKMKESFGAPIPSNQIEELAHYLGVVNGRARDSGPATVDSQGN
jgi:mono/diheme cytochrome c family protein